MKKTRNTKKSLILSALSLVLCIAMLLGTTYAWFTDSVTSGKNRIVAGNLDVDMLYKSGNMTEYATVQGVENDSDGFTPIFVDKNGDKVLWEPGAMVYTYFDVKNLGTLAFQYNLALQITGMNALVTDNVKHNLSEVIKTVVLDGEVAGDQIKASVEGEIWNSVESFQDQGSLVPNESKKFTVVLYWEPTDNDNLYNVNNGKTTTTYANWANEDSDALYINFDVQLTATQVPYESDSFDIFYDNIELGLIPASWSGESEEKDYNNGGTYEVVIDNDTKASVEVPAGAEDEDGNPLTSDDKLKLIVEPGADAKIKVETINSATTFDVSLIRVSDGSKVTSSTPMKVKLEVGDIDLVRFYHSGVQYENRKATEAEVLAVGDFYYDVTTGVITFMTNNFSPFSPVYKYSGGQGTEASPYKLSNANQLAGIVKEKQYILTEDIDISSVTSVSNNKYSFVSKINQAISVVIDGDNHKITCLDDSLESVFGDFTYSTLKNVTVDSSCPVTGYLNNGTFNNVTVDGSMEFSNNTGIMGYYCDGADVTNCTLNADVQSNSYSAVFFGYQFGGTYNVTNCTYTGHYTGPYAGFLLGNGHYKEATFNVTNLKNNGIIRHTLINSKSKNPFVGMNDDGQGWRVVINYNGTQYTGGPDGVGDNFVLEGTGQYIVGPEDTGLQLTVNADKTFTITKSQNANVDHYVVEIMTNVANIGQYGGSMNIAVSETISATEAASFTTKLKNFGFADGTTATYKLADTWDIITIEDVDYYLDVDPDSLAATTGKDDTWVNIRAYDANSKLVSANVYNYYFG